MTVEKSHLVRRTTFRDYHQQRLGAIEALPGPLRESFLQKEGALAAEMRDDDELWEWQARHAEQAPATSGLAIVRHGDIVRSWECYRPVVPALGSLPTTPPPLDLSQEAVAESGPWRRSSFTSFVQTPLHEQGVPKTILIDPTAPTADPSKPAFMTPPAGAKPYHGFPLLEETRQDGYCLGIITDPFEKDCADGCTIGDGFIEAPDGTRAGLMWNLYHEPRFAVVRPPHDAVWGTFLFTVPRPIACMDDLKRLFAEILPILKDLYARFHPEARPAADE